MIDRYTWYETVGIYAGIAVFLFFVLAPFIEGFLVSLKPLSLLFSSPYSFWPENGSLHRLFHHVGPRARCWALHLQRPVHLPSSAPSSCSCCGAGRLCLRPLPVSRRAAPLLGGFLAVNMFSGAVLLIPLYRLMRSLGRAQHLFRDDRARRRLPDPDRHLAAAHLHDAHSARARRGGLGRRRQPPLHAAPRHPAARHARHHRGRHHHLHRGLCAAVHLRADLQLQDRVHAARRRAVRLLRHARK